MCVQLCCACGRSPGAQQPFGCPDNLNPQVEWSLLLYRENERQMNSECLKEMQEICKDRHTY